eukprot:682460-Prorocentrum_minimum.AAC.2
MGSIEHTLYHVRIPQDTHNFAEPSEEELAALTGMSVARVHTVLTASYPVISLDGRIQESNGRGGGSCSPSFQVRSYPVISLDGRIQESNGGSAEEAIPYNEGAKRGARVAVPPTDFVKHSLNIR